MATENKELYGSLNLSPLEDSDYILTVPIAGTLQSNNVNNVYINCDTTNGYVLLVLPLISSLGGFNAKIYITNTVADPFSTVPLKKQIYVTSASNYPMVENLNPINGGLYLTIGTPNSTTVLSIGTDNQWLATTKSSQDVSTPIYDQYPYVITPTLIATQNTLNNGFLFGFISSGYKMLGTVELSGSSEYSIYLGSLETENFSFGNFIPTKISGIVTAYDGFQYYQNALAYRYELIDDELLTTVTSGFYITSDPYTYVNGDGVTISGLNFFMNVYPVSGLSGNLTGFISYEYDFLMPPPNTPTLILYP